MTNHAFEDVFERTFKLRYFPLSNPNVGKENREFLPRSVGMVGQVS